MGPSSYRRSRVVEFCQRLIWRKSILAEQLDDPEFTDQRETIRGQMQALNTVIREMITEFEISEDEFR